MLSIFRSHLYALAFVFPGAVCAMSASPDNIPDVNTVHKTVRFIAIGDMGTGEHGQYLVADAIAGVCAEKGCDFALGLGDNIYESGVDSVADLQFKTKFEDPYKNLNFPFYMTLGNHDNTWLSAGDGLDNDKGEIQVAYSYENNRPSDKWHMPARMYSFTAPLNETTPLIQFISLDSNPLAAVSDGDYAYWQLPYRDKEVKWLKQTLSSSTAPWKIAFSHHPFISNGRHGNAGLYDGVPGAGLVYYDMLKNNLCGKVDLLISGHEHDLQLLKASDKCGKTVQIVSGAGAKSRDLKDTSRNAAHWQLGGTLGFFYLQIEGDILNISVYTVDADSGETSLAYQYQQGRN
ncbi:MAG: metallophosphoesterase [Oceanospirillaceae bacterium]|nr:metallophosphoesterase [Oceanospirillaceae bacterium]MCP5350379.1 metallophosphoesterase [Oceanospirillaceae bacterium]